MLTPHPDFRSNALAPTSLPLPLPPSFLFVWFWGVPAHVHYFGPSAWGRGGQAFWVMVGWLRALVPWCIAVWGPSFAASPRGVLGRRAFQLLAPGLYPLSLVVCRLCLCALCSIISCLMLDYMLYSHFFASLVSLGLGANSSLSTLSNSGRKTSVSMRSLGCRPTSASFGSSGRVSGAWSVEPKSQMGQQVQGQQVTGASEASSY